MVTLVVEDGSIVSGANTYVTRAEAIAYAEARGVTLAASSATDTLIIKACDYLESKRNQFKGWIVENNQPLAWPRSDVVIEGWEWGLDEIPRQVINAQLALVLELNAGEDLYNPTQHQGPITQETVQGAVSVSYASATSSKVSKERASDALVRLLLRQSGLMVSRA